jgi:hypothetical protein
MTTYRAEIIPRYSYRIVTDGAARPYDHSETFATIEEAWRAGQAHVTAWEMAAGLARDGGVRRED